MREGLNTITFDVYLFFQVSLLVLIAPIKLITQGRFFVCNLGHLTHSSVLKEEEFHCVTSPNEQNDVFNKVKCSGFC